MREASVVAFRVVLLAMAVVASARSMEGQGIFGPGAGYVGAGVSGVGTRALDDRLNARGYPTFGQSAVGVNIGAYHILAGGLTVGGEWHGLIIGDAVHQGREVGIGGGYGTLGLGYMFNLSPRLRVYPRIGLGGGGLGLWFESDSAMAFDDVLADPRPRPEPPREPVLSRGTVVMDLGLGAELLPGGWGRGFMVGVRLGYLAAPSSADWQLDGYEVTGAPKASLAGPYVRAIIGIGRSR